MLEQRNKVDAMLAFQVNGLHPFDCSAGDLAVTSLEQAHAIATMIGSAFADSEATATTNGEIVCSAFNGIARLIALAAFAGGAA